MNKTFSPRCTSSSFGQFCATKAPVAVLLIVSFVKFGQLANTLSPKLLLRLYVSCLSAFSGYGIPSTSVLLMGLAAVMPGFLEAFKVKRGMVISVNPVFEKALLPT